MNIREENIRSFFRTFSVEDIVNSDYLFGIDFAHDSINIIMESLSLLYEEVKELRKMIDSNFETYPKILNPQSSEVQVTVAQDLSKKEFVLLKALGNRDVFDAFLYYKISCVKGEVKQSR